MPSVLDVHPGNSVCCLIGRGKKCFFFTVFSYADGTRSLLCLDHSITSEGTFTDFFCSRLTNLPGRYIPSEEIPLLVGSIASPSGLPLLKFRLIAGVFFYVHVFNLPLCPSLLFCPSFRILGTDYSCFARRILMPHVHYH